MFPFLRQCLVGAAAFGGPQINGRAGEGAGPYEIQIIQESDKHNDKVFTVKVISNGDPSQTVLTNEQKFCLAMVEISEYVNA